MDFDHREPLLKGPGPRGNRERQKSYGVRGVARLLASCDLVCACCHRLRTDDRGDHLLKQPPSPRTSKDAARRERNRRKRLEASALIQELKGRPCLDCGRLYPPVCMDFDHVRGEKLMNVSVMPTRMKVLARIREEVAKCDLVCANCHRVRTESRRVECNIEPMDVNAALKEFIFSVPGGVKEGEAVEHLKEVYGEEAAREAFLRVKNSREVREAEGLWRFPDP